MKPRILATLSLLALLAGPAWAQSGRISGSVRDKQTKEALIGANVLVMGTRIGAATDVEGRFSILNLAPGIYGLQVTYVGYQSTTIKNVQVLAGVTAFVEKIELASAAVEAEAVEVIAERPLIQKGATNAMRVVSAEEFENLPQRDTEQIIALQPGVVLQNDRLHIRGSRADEVGFVIEGANTKDIVSRDGGNMISLIPEALQEMQVQTGGYPAEFGGSNAGIVQTSFRTGGERIHFSFQGESDDIPGMAAGEQVLNTYSYGYNDLVVTASGPILFNNVRFFVTGENYSTRDYSPTYWYGFPKMWSNGEEVGKVVDTGVRGGTAGDSSIAPLTWASGNIASRMQKRSTANGTVLFDLGPLQVRTAGVYSKQQTRSNGSPIRNLFATDRLPLTDQTEVLFNTRLSYFLNPKTFLEVNVNALDRRSETQDPDFKDDVLAYGDSLRTAEIADEDWAPFRSYTNGPASYDFYGFPFTRPGTSMSSYNKRQTAYTGGSVAFTTQVGRHELKAGAKDELWTVRNFSLSGLGSLLNFMRLNPDSIRAEDAFARMIRTRLTPNIYGFDEFGNLYDGTQKGNGPKHPRFTSAYLQDRIEYNDIIINAGLRYDYIFMDNFVFEDPTQPEVNKQDYTLINIKKGRPYEYVQPRLGFSFPVADRTVFHLQYGKFVQAPGLDVTYRGSAAMAFVMTGGYYFSNPVAYDIKPEESTQYEVGFSQQFTDFAAFDVTAFYKDVQNQLQFDSQPTTPGWAVSNYPIYSNQDFAITKGLEFQLRLRRVSRVMGQFNYTLASARGTNSFANSAGGALEGPGGKAPKMTTPLTYDQTHRGSINIDYRFGKGDGGRILERTGLNLLFTFNSGHRFTLAESPGGLGQSDASSGGILNDGDSRQRAPLEPINSSTTPWFFNLDARLDRSVSIAGVDVNFYVYVQNVLDRRNVVNVYYATGLADDDGFLTSKDGAQVVAGYGERFADLYRSVNLDNRQHNWSANGFDLFGNPRQFRVGLQLDI